MDKPSVGTVFRYFLKEYPEDVKQALRTFTNARHVPQETDLTEEQMQSFFGSWFLFNYHLPDKDSVPLTFYLQKKQNELSSEEYIYYQSLLNSNVFDVFEVVRIDRGQGLRVRQLRTGTEFEVRERKGTYEMEVGEILITRLWNTGSEWQLAPDILGYPPAAAPMIRQWIESWPVDYRLQPLEVWEAFSRPKVSSTEEGEVTLEEFLRDHEAYPVVHGRDVVEWLRDSQNIHETVQRVMAHITLPDKDDFLELIQLMHLVWNTLPSRERGAEVDMPDAWEPGLVERELLERLYREVQQAITLDRFESTADANHAIAEFQKQWINTPLADYDGKTPRQIVAEERTENGHPVHDWTVNITVEQWGDPHDERINALLRAGNDAHRHGDLVLAERRYRDITTDYPEVYKAWGNLGLVLASQGRKQEAIEALKQALSIEPDYQLARQNLAAIQQAASEQLTQRRNVVSASLLRIGIKEQAFTELTPHLRSDLVQQTSAWRDATAALRRLVEKKKLPLTPQRQEFTRASIHEINGLLVNPDPVEEVLTGPGGKRHVLKHSRQHEFPVVDRLYYLLQAVGVATRVPRSYQPTDQAAVFLEKTVIEQYVALLWGYFAEMKWDTCFTDRDTLNELRATIDHMVQEIVPERLGHLLLEARKSEWVSQEALQRHIQHAINAKREISNDDNEESSFGPAMFLSLGEEQALWVPLEWFGLVEIRWDTELGGVMRLMSEIRLTELGKIVVPQLATQPIQQLRSNKVGRNEPCPCGSGKKYKKCHGK